VSVQVAAAIGGSESPVSSVGFSSTAPTDSAVDVPTLAAVERTRASLRGVGLAFCAIALCALLGVVLVGAVFGVSVNGLAHPAAGHSASTHHITTTKETR
jgi:hypothetical protein